MHDLPTMTLLESSSPLPSPPQVCGEEGDSGSGIPPLSFHKRMEETDTEAGRLCHAAARSATLDSAHPPTLTAIGDGHRPPLQVLGSTPPPPSPAREVAELNQRFAGQPTSEVLAWAWERFGNRAAIGTSFQGAGLVMMHLAKMAGLAFPVFTLDTGLLFPETLALKRRLEDFYGWKIEAIEPDLTVEEQADVHGPELWKRDPDLCCTARKVLPLRGKLEDLACWLTGLRRQQSQARAAVQIVELYHLDEETGREIVKVNPMAHWSREEVWSHIQKHQIPYNPLHDQGWRSIGCMTCSRKSAEGEEERAGRWIGFKKVECGIHTFLPKKVDFQI